MPRNQKTSSYNDNIVREAEAIYARVEDWGFHEGYRGLLLLHRKKDGFDGAYPQRDCKKRIVSSKEEYINCLCEFLDLKYKSEHELRIYASLNPRSMDKAIRLFKHDQLDADYYDTASRDSFYTDISNRMFSNFMCYQARAGTLFIIDVDDNSIMGDVDKKIAELELTVYTKYATKNGWHIVVAPFNPELWSMDKTDIKKDPLILLKY